VPIEYADCRAAVQVGVPQALGEVREEFVQAEKLVALAHALAVAVDEDEDRSAAMLEVGQGEAGKPDRLVDAERSAIGHPDHQGTDTGAQHGRSRDHASVVADVERLKGIVPTQSHTMLDVGYHWANLWFAAQQKNWPLATFYFDETRSHILWTIRIRPIRKDDAGQPVDLKSIFDGIDSSSFAGVKDAIAQRDLAKFTAAYKVGLESCYACHKASSKPYLRPAIPQAPPQPIINFSADAPWPQ